MRPFALGRPAVRDVFLAGRRPNPLFTFSTSFQRRTWVRGSRHSSTDTSHLPRVAQPSLWKSMIPKSLRQRSNKPVPPTAKGWNPASYFVIIFLLIGSQAIRLITLQNDFLNYSRNADAKIALLREVIERVQKGEDVDVERILGTGDEVKEREWEEGESCIFNRTRRARLTPISPQGDRGRRQSVDCQGSQKAVCHSSDRRTNTLERQPGQH